jgi:hypothetical protein
MMKLIAAHVFYHCPLLLLSITAYRLTFMKSSGNLEATTFSIAQPQMSQLLCYSRFKGAQV